MNFWGHHLGLLAMIVIPATVALTLCTVAFIQIVSGSCR